MVFVCRPEKFCFDSSMLLGIFLPEYMVFFPTLDPFSYAVFKIIEYIPSKLVLFFIDTIIIVYLYKLININTNRQM